MLFPLLNFFQYSDKLQKLIIIKQEITGSRNKLFFYSKLHFIYTNNIFYLTLGEFNGN